MYLPGSRTFILTLSSNISLAKAFQLSLKNIIVNSICYTSVFNLKLIVSGFVVFCLRYIVQILKLSP